MWFKFCFGVSFGFNRTLFPTLSDIRWGPQTKTYPPCNRCLFPFSFMRVDLDFHISTSENFCENGFSDCCRNSSPASIWHLIVLLLLWRISDTIKTENDIGVQFIGWQCSFWWHVSLNCLSFLRNRPRKI